MDLFALVIMEGYEGAVDERIVEFSIHASRADAVDAIYCFCMEIYCFCMENWDYDDMEDPEGFTKDEAIETWFDYTEGYSYYYKQCKVKNYPKPLKKDDPDVFLGPRQINVVNAALSNVQFGTVAEEVGLPVDVADVEIHKLLKQFPKVEE